MGPDDAPEERIASKDEIDSLNFSSPTKPNPRVEAPPTGPMGPVDSALDDSDEIWRQMVAELKQDEEHKKFNNGLAADAAATEAQRKQELDEEAKGLPPRLPGESIGEYAERNAPPPAEDDTQLTKPIKDASKHKRFGIF